MVDRIFVPEPDLVEVGEAELNIHDLEDSYCPVPEYTPNNEVNCISEPMSGSFGTADDSPKDGHYNDSSQAGKGNHYVKLELIHDAEGLVFIIEM